jgi:hypothetical protein
VSERSIRVLDQVCELAALQIVTVLSSHFLAICFHSLQSVIFFHFPFLRLRSQSSLNFKGSFFSNKAGTFPRSGIKKRDQKARPNDTPPGIFWGY